MLNLVSHILMDANEQVVTKYYFMYRIFSYNQLK